MTIFNQAATTITNLYEDLLTDTVDVLTQAAGEDALGNPSGAWSTDHQESAYVQRLTETELAGADPILTRQRRLHLAASSTVVNTNRISWDSKEWTVRSVEPINVGGVTRKKVAVIEEVE